MKHEPEEKKMPSKKNEPRQRATELEWLRWFAQHADFGPADGDVQHLMKEEFMKKTGKNLPEGWNFGPDGETTMDKA